MAFPRPVDIYWLYQYKSIHLSRCMEWPKTFNEMSGHYKNTITWLQPRGSFNVITKYCRYHFQKSYQPICMMMMGGIFNFGQGCFQLSWSIEITVANPLTKIGLIKVKYKEKQHSLATGHYLRIVSSYKQCGVNCELCTSQSECEMKWALKCCVF